MHPLSLEALTIDDASPLELVEAAAASAADAISLLVQPRPPRPDWGLISSPALRRDVKNRCRDLNILIDTCEAFRIVPSTDIQGFTPALEAAAELGAKSITVLAQDDDCVRIGDKFSRLNEIVKSFGLLIVTEFTPRMSFKTLPGTIRLLDEFKLTDVLIEADSLHLYRSGGSAEDVTRAGKRVGRAQLCDGPRAAPADGLHEAISERAYPGEGELPLVEFVRALPPGIVIGIETPSAKRIAAGLTVQERASRAMDAARRVIAQAL